MHKRTALKLYLQLKRSAGIYAKENKMVDRVKKMWYNYTNGKF